MDELQSAFGGYVLEERIGFGGMGTVFSARQETLDRPVAIKVLHREIASKADVQARFQREAQALAGLRHPGIVAVHDIGTAGEWTYIAMELVDGVDLRQLVRSRELTPKDALSIVVQICEALQYAHDRAVVHRDIKPENILVDTEGKVRILDFGLAKLLTGDVEAIHLTGTSQVMGTVHYMAPEQWENPQSVDHRADIFSLGVVFYELLTGELPVGRFQPPSSRVQLDVRLDEVVLRALEREPAKRYQQASEFGDKVGRKVEDNAPQSRARTSTSRRDFRNKLRSRLRATQVLPSEPDSPAPYFMYSLLFLGGAISLFYLYVIVAELARDLF